MIDYNGPEAAHKTLNAVEAGFVRRYHTHPRLGQHGQTDAQHAWNVAALVLSLHPKPSDRLLKACIMHDVGERFCGDIPAPVKRDNPDVKAQMDRIEDSARIRHFRNANPPLHRDEQNWLKMCDMLECVLYVSIVDPAILNTQPWQDLIDAIVERADKLHCPPIADVLELINTAIRRQGIYEAPTERKYE